MRRVARFVLSVLIAVLAMIVAESVTSEDAESQQPFPAFAADTSVRNRLAQEWEQDNRYQHERGYCVLYKILRGTTDDGTPIVLYWVTDIMRADEEHESATGGFLTCPRGIANQTLLHIHPPAFCPERDEGRHCMASHPMGQQCFPSPVDLSELNRSSQPFWVIQCDEHALVPVWRTEPYPPLTPSPDGHR